MKKIELIQRGFVTKKIFVLVDDEDYHWLVQYNWYAVKHPHKNTTYAEARINGHKTSMHQLLLPSEDKYLTPDHKDRDGLNNQRNNLRFANNSQQQQNQDKQEDCSSQFKGVAYNKRKKRWLAYINKDGKRTYLGAAFKTEFEAALAYNNAAKELHGEFAVLNVVVIN